MSCPLVHSDPELLLDYCAGRLSGERAATFERHMAGCDACRSEARAQQAIWRALDDWDNVPLSPDFNRRLFSAIESERQGGFWERLRTLPERFGLWSWKPVLAASAACAAITIGLLVHSPSVPGAKPADSQVKIEKVDADQVEEALDDVEMIRGLSSQTATAPAM